MGTRIYDGVKFKSKDFKEVLDQLTSIKKECIDIAEKSFKKDDIELFVTSNKLTDKSNRDVFNAIKLAAVHPNPFEYSFSLRFKFSIVLYPTKEGDIYGYFFSSNHKYEPLLKQFVDEFEYYDSSDKPDNITDEEWSARSDKWDELVPNRFDETGFTFNIVSIHDVEMGTLRTKIDEVMSYIKRDNTINEVLK